MWVTLDDVVFWLASAEDSPERSVLEREKRDIIQQALQQLPEQYRLVMILRYWQDLSYNEIVDVTGLSESAVKTRLHRGRKMLAEALGAEGEVEWNIKTTTS